MADRHVIYKQAAKEIAAAQGASLTFMAKFDEKLAGSSLHIHTSLWSPKGEPLFGEKGETLPGTPVHAPPLFRRFLAGLLAHARELALVLRALSELVQALPRRHLRADRDRLELRQPHGGLPDRRRGRLAARRVPDPGRRRESLSRLRGACWPPASTGSSASSTPARAFEGDVYAAKHLPHVPAHAARGARASSRRAPSPAAPSATP